MADISFIVTSPNTSSERRISPHWNPPSFQTLQIFIAHSETPIVLAPAPGSSDESTALSEFPDALVPFARLNVEDTRPPGVQENYTDVSGVEKFELTDDEYARRTDTVLAYKKRNKLGRFADDAQKPALTTGFKKTIEERAIEVGKRCRVLEPVERRGVVRYVGSVPELPSAAGADPDDDIWVGVEFDEPVGKHDGSVRGERYFTARNKHGSFFRPEKVEVGEYPEIDDLFDDSDEEV
ncbi:CAP-Gly domain-containing protein [Myxozyma melibiosi]|uniref:CAP-Gly domain-containing protein n=1 Tax=Myxozyma melibiosi TaxID=54550 RepID=A0ABR1F223_9ASCO